MHEIGTRKFFRKACLSAVKRRQGAKRIGNPERLRVIWNRFVHLVVEMTINFETRRFAPWREVIPI